MVMRPPCSCIRVTDICHLAMTVKRFVSSFVALVACFVVAHKITFCLSVLGPIQPILLNVRVYENVATLFYFVNIKIK